MERIKNEEECAYNLMLDWSGRFRSLGSRYDKNNSEKSTACKL